MECPHYCVCSFSDMSFGCRSNLSILSRLDNNNTKSITLHNQDITVLPKASFANFVKLVSLTINYADMKTLSVDSFLGIYNIETLDFSHNSIVYIEERSFYDLQNLTRLILYNNSLEHIPSIVMNYLNRIHVLNVGMNNISVPFFGKCYRNLTVLQVIIMNNNPIRQITHFDFVNLNYSNLNQLDLSSCQINFYIIYSHFYMFRNIQWLNLANNIIEPDNIRAILGSFAPFKLKFLNLSFIEARHFGTHTSIFSLFYPNRIKSIDFSGNKFIRLNQEDLRGLNKVVTLNFDNNRLKYLNIAASYIALKYLKLNYNSFKNTSCQSFQIPKFITKIELNYNKLDIFDGKCFSPKLLWLGLSHNNLKLLKNIDTLKSLKVLDLSGNFLDRVPTMITYSQLEYLYISGNIIRALKTEDFNGLTSLKYLDLAHNLIHTIEPFTFTKLNSLSTLMLDYNPLTHIYNDTHYKSLSNYSSSHVHIYDYLTASSLSMSYNNLTDQSISGIFSHVSFPNITYINLTGNMLRIFNPAVFLSFIHLKSLNLSGNSIRTISPDSFTHTSPLQSLSILDLKGNNITCECNLHQWLIRQFWLLKNSFDLRVEKTCSAYHNYNNRTVTNNTFDFFLKDEFCSKLYMYKAYEKIFNID
ncbi:unnamed protein product [Gordionus sp. m RMFG-2023]